jgi:hypothetical protein
MPEVTVLAFTNNKNSFCIILKPLYMYLLGLGGEWQPFAAEGPFSMG